MKTRFLSLLFLLLGACQNCGPTREDYFGCAAACSARGVASVTFTECRRVGDNRPDMASVVGRSFDR